MANENSQKLLSKVLATATGKTTAAGSDPEPIPWTDAALLLKDGAAMGRQKRRVH
jgi:hypothetical protein